MVTESATPKFTSPGARIWNAILADAQQKLVSMAWCSTCRQETTIVGYSGSIKAGHVLLRGSCTACGESAYRFVEVTRNKDKSEKIVFGKSKLTSSDAVIAGELAQKEMKVLRKRKRQLDKKEYEGTITKAEQNELKRIYKTGMDEALHKMGVATCQIMHSIDS